MYLPASAPRSSHARSGPLAAMALCLAFAAPAQAQSEKAAEDPTKIATKVGVAYSDELSVSGSLAIGPKFKFNGRVSESGQWQIGASYLFPVAILTFSAGKSQFDSGVEQVRYSLGGFVPLTQLGLKTGKWNFFVPFGYTYTDGKQVETESDMQDGLPVEMNSNSGYVGLFVIRPLSKKLTLMAGGNVTKGTNDFSGVAAAGGLSYHLGKRDTIAVRASYIDNSYGQKEKIGISYQHEF